MKPSSLGNHLTASPRLLIDSPHHLGCPHTLVATWQSLFPFQYCMHTIFNFDLVGTLPSRSLTSSVSECSATVLSLASSHSSVVHHCNTELRTIHVVLLSVKTRSHSRCSGPGSPSVHCPMAD